MKRKIITIDEEKCDGCGDCVTECAEGALQIVGGKAKLVKELFCDGFGDCIGVCPTGALKIEEREADAFDLDATLSHVKGTLGDEGVGRLKSAHNRHQQIHPEVRHAPASGGCPGSRMRVLNDKEPLVARTATSLRSGPTQAIPSELRQWPIQIHLVRPDAPYFAGKEIVVMSTCGPIASADTHWRYIRGRGVVVGCPKLDDTSGYAEKLAAIFSYNHTPKVIVVRMEVPCCGGLTTIVKQAAQLSGEPALAIEEVFLGINGDVLG